MCWTAEFVSCLRQSFWVRFREQALSGHSGYRGDLEKNNLIPVKPGGKTEPDRERCHHPRLIGRAKLSVAFKLLSAFFYPVSIRNEAAGRRKQSSGNASALSRSRTI